jgi:tRNA G18 (ribose-2'-O)-methylase SpoU
LEDIVDHTNVGDHPAQNAAGLGWHAAPLLAAGRALYRRSIKVSMGAVFSLPWARLTDWADAPDLLRRSGFGSIALTPQPTRWIWRRPGARRSAQTDCVLLGTEGVGLSAAWPRCRRSARS